MSRDMLHVTIHLPDGKSLEGMGRNLPSTIEKVYNKAFGKHHGRHAVILEQLRTGHAGMAEHRYEGTFDGGVVDDAGSMGVEQPFTVDARLQAPLKSSKAAA